MLLFEINQSTALVRVNFDLPSLEDTARITDSLATIKQLLDQQNRIVLLSHWGRPKDKDKNLSLKNQIDTINKIFAQNNLPKVEFCDQFEDFSQTKQTIQTSKSSIFLLENTRYDAREQSKNELESQELAKKYASLGDYFVNEAFAVSHRSEVTNSTIQQYLPSCLGLSFDNEVKSLTKLRDNPNHPFVVVMGGAKLETKLPLIQKMIQKADKIIISGLLAFTFLQAQKDMNRCNLIFPESLVEVDFLPIAKNLLLNFPTKIVLPVDFVKENDIPLDVGNESVKKFDAALSTAKTIFWNGTLGKYEQKPFDKATRELANFIGTLHGTYTVVGGGDTVSALDSETLANFKFISMGGGATLEFLAG